MRTDLETVCAFEARRVTYSERVGVDVTADAVIYRNIRIEKPAEELIPHFLLRFPSYRSTLHRPSNSLLERWQASMGRPIVKDKNRGAARVFSESGILLGTLG